MKIDLYVTEKCIPCLHILSFMDQYGVSDKINILVDEKHPLVSSHPSIVFNGASIIKGVEAIENFLSVHLVPKEV